MFPYDLPSMTVRDPSANRSLIAFTAWSWRIVAGFAALGFAVAVPEWAFMRNYIHLDPNTAGNLMLLNPMVLVGFVFAGSGPPLTEREIAITQLILVFCNTALYAGVGAVIAMVISVVRRLRG
jgi:hypothetical protein